ncbi:MAG TPA: DUF2628 domain-containing protein [Xanthobacteraceae bacterium]|jgi:hypothetical protein|nr:DUF2628 domain-containing protein [Xanthobacteraceae bacterium]
MAVYSVFEPPGDGANGRAAPDRFVFVRDGFSWGAFLFGPLWMVWRRLWLVLLLYLIVVAVLGIALVAFRASAGAEAAVGIVLALLLGLEAATLRGWTLKRRGWTEAGIVIADGIEFAERRFFDARPAGRIGTRPASNQSPPLRPPPGSSDIIGLFPQPGGGR